MTDLIFIGAALLSFGLGMLLLRKFVKEKPVVAKPRKRDCPPHTWKELPTGFDDNTVYLRCDTCGRSLAELFGEE